MSGVVIQYNQSLPDVISTA